MRTGIAMLLLVLAWPAVAALQGARVTVRAVESAPAVRSVTGLSYESFDEAAAFWDVEAARRVGTRGDQQSYVDAMRSLIDGDEPAAEQSLLAIRSESKDGALRQLSTKLLEQLYFADGRWERFRALDGEGAPDDPFRTLVEVLAGGPSPELAVPEETVVVTTPDAGLPTLRVAVNGKSFDFILDTGAPFTVVNADVAREAGILPIGEREGLIRNDVRGRPARIDRLEIGGVVAEHHPVMIVPTEDMTIPERPSEQKTIEGILGWPLIRQMDIELDLVGERTILRKPEHRPVGERNFFFFFRPIVIARDATGMPLHFLLDSGTDGTTLCRRIGKKTTLGKVKRAKIGSSRIGETSRDEDGRFLPRFEIYLDDHLVRFEKIPLMPGSFVDGILGTDVHATRRVRIDYVNGRYTLEP